MSQDFHIFILQRHSPQSHTYVGDLRHTDNRRHVYMTYLLEIVLEDIKSRREFKSWGEDVNSIDNFELYRLHLQGPAMRKMIQQGKLEDFTRVSMSGDTDGYREFLFVFKSSSFRFILFQTIGSSRRCLTIGRATGLPGQNVDIIEQAAQDCVKACFNSNYEADVHVWEPQQPFKVDEKLTAQSKQQLDELINEEYMSNCAERRSDCGLEDITHREHLIITFTLRFKFFLFERGPSPSPCIGCGEVVGWAEDPIEVIKRIAGERIKEALSIGSDPAVEFSVDQVNLYEPKGLYQKTLEQMESILNDNQLARTRGLVTLFNPGDPLKKISGSNLIVECVVTRHHKLQFKYRLFERKPESFEFVGRGSVETSSKKTMQVVWDAVRRSIESLPNHGLNTGHHIQVYEPTEAFEEVYDKSTRDIHSFKLEEKHLQANPVKCAALLPQQTLSDVDPGQTLVVVFDLPPA